MTLISETFKKNDAIPRSLQGEDVYIKVAIREYYSRHDVIHVKICRDYHIIAVRSGRTDIFVGETMRPIYIPLDVDSFVDYDYVDIDIQVQLA